MVDDSEFISMFVFNKITTKLYTDVFKVDSFDEAVESEIDGLDEENNSELNKRLLNLIGQFRADNKGITQPLRVFFVKYIFS